MISISFAVLDVFLPSEHSCKAAQFENYKNRLTTLLNCGFDMFSVFPQVSKFLLDFHFFKGGKGLDLNLIEDNRT